MGGHPQPLGSQPAAEQAGDAAGSKAGLVQQPGGQGEIEPPLGGSQHGGRQERTCQAVQQGFWPLRVVPCLRDREGRGGQIWIQKRHSEFQAVVHGHCIAIADQRVVQTIGPVELTPEMIRFYEQSRGNLINIPGVPTPINVAPAQSQLMNILVYLALAAAVVLIMRRK